MPAKGCSTPSGTEDVQPVELCREDRKQLYNLLYADVPARLRRLEFGGIALTVAVASPKLGGPSVGELATGLVHLFLR